MPVCYKTSDMKFEPRFDPKLPKDVRENKLISTYLQKREVPKIEMTMAKDGVFARVEFYFVHLTKNMATAKLVTDYYTKIFIGPSDDIYKDVARQASRIGLNLERQFNSEWNKTLMQLLNKPSKNKTILNLGIYKKDGYGIYDVTQPSELLNQKIIESKLKLKDVAILSGVDETTLFRHLKGTFEISREIAIKYAKALGCDPSEILFNSLNIPVWASTDTQETTMLNKFSVYASELKATQKFSNVQCPREIYRPDVKAIIIDQPNSLYHGHVAYYYNSNEALVFEDQIVIVGTKIKNFHDDDVRLRYFIGIYKKNKNGRTIDLHSIDPDVINYKDVTADEDFHDFNALAEQVEQDKIVIEDITPEFVAPVVALVNNSKIYTPVKTEILKAYDKIYTQSRKEDFDAQVFFRKLRMNAALQGKLSEDISDYFSDEEYGRTTQISDRIKLLIKQDKRFQTILDKNPFSQAVKQEKRIKLRDQVRQLDIKLSAEEEKIVTNALEKLREEYETPDFGSEERNKEASR